MHRSHLALIVVASAACARFGEETPSGPTPIADGGNDGATSSSSGASSSGASSSGDGASGSGCDGVPATILEEFSAPSFPGDWTPHASGAKAEFDIGSSLSPPKSMRVDKITGANTSAFAYIEKVAPGAAREICADFATILDSFGTSRDEHEIAIFSLTLASPGTDTKDYTISVLRDGGGGATIFEHANSEQGQPDIVNQRHAVVGSTLWADARWSSLSLRIALDRKELSFRVGGSELLRTNIVPPPSNTGTTVRVGVISEANPAGVWSMHHDNVYIRFVR